MITPDRRNLFTLQLAAGICFVLTSVFASAQTLVVVQPTRHSVSPRLSDIRGGHTQVNGPTEIPRHLLPLQANYQNGGSNGQEGEGGSSGASASDPVQQTSFGPLVAASTGSSFDGLSVYDGGYIPSDNNIAVGPNHIVETVNAAYAIYGKDGSGGFSGDLRSLWTTLGGNCSANNGGDPIVQYDRGADRWIITQLGSLRNPYSECIAVSMTSDPGGAYNLYSYSFGNSLNDYPKFGVWYTASNSVQQPNGAYLATYNLFAHGISFAGAEICAYDRAAMLAGALSPVAICYTGISGASYLPADLDGPTAPPDGTAPYFIDLYSTGGSLGVYQMTPNFANPNASKLSKFTTIPVAPFTQASDPQQKGTSRRLDALSDRLMYRLALRMFSDHASIVANHSVQTGSRSGVRWYELTAQLDSNGDLGPLSRAQQGTFAQDSDSRWMGSAAMDQAGNIAMGYSVSSSSTYPSVRYTGRNPNDAPGTMQSEASIVEGTGSQTGYSRWGDYSSLRSDPYDDCTFWYVNEYVPQTSSYGWYTRIGSFQFDGCGGTPTPLSITGPASLPDGTQDVAYTDTTVTASGGTAPYTWSATGLPAGLSINSSTGTISGTPTSAAGSPFSVTVTATDSASPAATADHSYSLTINAPPALSITGPASLPAGTQDVAYTPTTVTATGGTTPYTWSATGLPAGLSINSSTGTISGTPTVSGTFNPVTVKVTDNTLATATKDYSLTINAPPALSITGPSSLPAGTQDVAYTNTTVTATGGTTPYTWSATGLPAGMSINPSTGTISGTPTVSGTFNPVTVKVTDNALATSTKDYSLTINPPPTEVTVSGISPDSMSVGRSIPVTITGTGFAPGAVVTFENGQGPSPSASVDSVSGNGQSISATVTANSGGPHGTRTWDVRVTNPDGSTGVLVGGFSVIR